MTNTPVKKHICSWGDCGKSFSRSDHLQRHMLNHTAEGSTCGRCSAHFKRQDLLDRHLARHRQRDQEGRGQDLQTRKRMWRDADGNIVTKRPALQSQSDLDKGSGDDIAMNLAEEDRAPFADVQAPPSPPKSQPGTDLVDQPMQYNDDMNTTHDHQVFDFSQMPAREHSANDMYDFLANSSWGQKPSQSIPTSGQDVWDDAFAPDTASSFNMPYTTMNNYTWLFDVSATHPSYEAPAPVHMNIWGPQMTNEALTNLNNGPNVRTANQSNSHGLRTPHLPLQQQSQQHSLPMQAFLAQQEYQSLSSEEPPSLPAVSQTHSQRLSEAAQSSVTTSPEALSASDYSLASSNTSAAQHAPKQSPPYQRPFTASSLESTSIQSFHPCSTFRSMPQIDDLSRGRVVDLIVQAGTKTPDGLLVNRDHPLLSLASLQTYCDLFFTRFNTCYPLIHRPTFDPAQVETLFLLAVLLLGSTYGDKSAHRLAVCIHDVMRAQIFQHMSFTATPELWILQTILLVECFGKSRAGQKQHDMSHLFHGLLINLIRRSDCQTVQAPKMNVTDCTENLETHWRRAMQYEERKRLAQMCFLWDVQHAVLFSQSLCMSSFELRTALPCNPTVFEAETASEWQQHVRREPAPKHFLSVLKSYMSPSAPTQSHNLNALSRLLVLHGLMSVSWDFTRRDQTSLGCGSLIGTDDWRSRIGASYDTWKADFDTYCLNISSSLNRATDYPNVKSDFQRFTTSTLAIYHAAHIILNIEILDLQISAGARHIIGRPVSRTDYERSRRQVRDWAQQKPAGTTSACTAAWHAAQLLRDGIMNLDNWNVNNAFHYPWCLYLATLTCWAFHWGCREDPGTSAPANYDARSEDAVSLSMGLYADESSLDEANAEMNALVSGMTSGVPEGLWRIAGKYSARGLTIVMAQHLSNVRWAVVHEGMKVLKGLMAKQEVL